MKDNEQKLRRAIFSQSEKLRRLLAEYEALPNRIKLTDARLHAAQAELHKLLNPDTVPPSDAHLSSQTLHE